MGTGRRGTGTGRTGIGTGRRGMGTGLVNAIMSNPAGEDQVARTIHTRRSDS